MKTKLPLIILGQIAADELTLDELRVCINHFNDSYRKGAELISDHRYDHEFKAALARLSPNDDLLTRVEPEASSSFGDLPVIRHKRPMLSTENAFDEGAIAKFIRRVQKAAEELGIIDPQFKATGKLDGWSGNDVDGDIATRGDGLKGSNITHILKRGVKVIGGRNLGAGEIIVGKVYFDTNLADAFTCGRNFLASVINAETPNSYALQALADGACHFVPYRTLYSWSGTGENFLAAYQTICNEIEQESIYELDGIVLEVDNDELKK